MSTSNSSSPAIARKLKIWVMVVIGLAVLYALSAGPALMLAQRRLVSTDTVVAVYFSPNSPLEMLTGFVPGTGWLMKRYIGLWASDDPVP